MTTTDEARGARELPGDVLDDLSWWTRPQSTRDVRRARPASLPGRRPRPGRAGDRVPNPVRAAARRCCPTLLPDIEAAAEPDLLRSNFLHGVKHLPARFTPTAPRP
ncbi:hypothetical protein [Frankia sp. QA3]|uniref:hypothetical protein n=1 Tax=Frankia sp. QA3 TaxID=710111 RepID=UPI0002ED5C7E|nr:hypothetical protein [Frankia sp. QA3]